MAVIASALEFLYQLPLGMMFFLLVHYLSSLPAFLRLISACCKRLLQGCEGGSVGSSAEEVHEEEQEGTDPGNSPLAERLIANRIDYFLGLCQIWRQFCGVYGTAYLLRWAFGHHRINDPIISIVLLVTYITASVVQLCPRLVNNSTLWAMHSCFMGCLLLYAVHVSMHNTAAFTQYNPQVHLSRLTISIAYPKALPNLLWNTAWVVTAIVVRMVRSDPCGGVPLSNIVIDELVAAAFVTFVLWEMEQLQVSQVRSDLEASGYARAKAAMEKLLADMCDAVVELNPQLHISRGCPKLASLLLRQNGAKALKGDAFPSLICYEADQERFRQFVTPTEQLIEHDVEPGERPSSIYMNLRDAIGTPLAVQLFHSYHYDPPREVCHIVGVREVERDNVADTVNDTFGEAVQAPVQNDHASVNDDIESVVSRASSSASSASGVGDTKPIFAPLVPEHEQYAPVSVIIDAVRMKIIGCTNGFKALTGPLLYQSDVRNMVVNLEEFETWLRAETNSYLNDLPGSPFNLRLTPPMVRKQGRFEFRGIVELIIVQEAAFPSELGVEQPEGHEEEEFNMLCVLELKDAEPHWSNSSRRGKRRIAQADRRQVPSRCSL